MDYPRGHFTDTSASGISRPGAQEFVLHDENDPIGSFVRYYYNNR